MSLIAVAWCWCWCLLFLLSSNIIVVVVASPLSAAANNYNNPLSSANQSTATKTTILMMTKHKSSSASSRNGDNNDSVGANARPPRHQLLFHDIPKQETGINHLHKNKNCDGSGIKIAIMDTGCDLSARGLSGNCSDGKTHKYIDFVDCTGDGDVDMSTTVTINPNNCTTKNNGIITVVGVSGRNCTLDTTTLWGTTTTNNIKKELKMGAIRLYDLLPQGVLKRVKKERKEIFMEKHRILLSNTQVQLDALLLKSNNNNDGGGSNNDNKKNDDGKEDKNNVIETKKKELKLMLEQLMSIKDTYDEDSGPIMDIFMFQDNDGVWKAIIDIEANGDLTNFIPMAPFRYARQVGELGFGSHVTFCIQVYDEGKTLSIVTDAGSHGTHVAGIAASYFGPTTTSSSMGGENEKDDEGMTTTTTTKEKKSNDYNLNGVAPGAQILSIKIGDGRLGSAETGTGLIRGLIAAKKYGCDLVNLSYGEPSWQPDVGRVSEVFAKAFNDWGMTVFTSAGNDGPALSSLGSPGSLTSIITVGAYVSPEMAREQYSTLPPENGDSPLQGSSYYFSSRGPTPDGFLPDVCGPGGAVAPVPRAALQGKTQMHGTSMSSPNVCGVAACVLSAVRQNGVKDCGPNELKRALKNTAVTSGVADPFSQGSGLVSALDCVEYIIKNHGKEGQSIAIDVSIPSRDRARGLYIRDEIELDGRTEFSIQVNPKFSHSKLRTSREMDELLSLELHLLLKSTEEWVTCPESMTLMSANRNFSVRLNTQGLRPGVHYASVHALDASDEARGPLFTVPVTVIVPHSRFVSKDKPKFHLNDSSEERIELKDNGLDLSTTFRLEQGIPNRRFVTVPLGAEWATIKVKSTEATTTVPRILLHAIPFVRGDMPNKECQLKQFFYVNEGVEQEYHIRVKGGSSLEVCLQLLWLSNPSPALVTADIEFHSFNIRSPNLMSSQPITITAASEFARLGASAPLRAEQLNPECKLKSLLRTLRPNNVYITLGSAGRDSEPPSDADLASNVIEEPSRIYEMRLSYQFKVEGDKPIEVRPSFPSLFNQLYDSPVDSQLWSLQDNNSKVITYGSCMHHASPTSLKKGDYTVSLLLRHPRRSTLDQMKDLPCEISMNLPSALSCNLYSELDKASTPAVKDDGRKPMEKKLLCKGSFQDIYVARPIDDLPSWAVPGDFIQGTLVLDKDKEAVSSMKILYVVPPKATVKNGDDEKSKTKEKEDSLEDVIFNAKLGHLASLRAKNVTVYKEIVSALKKERPHSIPLLTEMLTFALEGPFPDSETGDEDQVRLMEVDKVYNQSLKENGGPIDPLALAQYFGLNEPDKDELEADDEATELNKVMKEQRDALKKILLERASLYGSVADKNSSKVPPFEKAVKELKQWIKLESLKDDDEKIKLTITLGRHARICQEKMALAISLLLKAKKDLSSGKNLKQLDEELLTLYDLVDGMSHVKENLKESMCYRYPVFKRNV
jgi:tripeptidyl-peptidase-2